MIKLIIGAAVAAAALASTPALADPKPYEIEREYWKDREEARREHWKGRAEARREYAKDRREAWREREKDRREAEREYWKDSHDYWDYDD